MKELNRLAAWLFLGVILLKWGAVDLQANLPPPDTNVVVRLSWQPSASPEVIGYRVFFGLQALDNEIDAGSATSITISNLTNTKIYHFAVLAYDEDQVESQLSEELVFLTGGNDLPPLITEHPTSQDIAIGGEAELAVVASGVQTLKYQWFKDGVTVTNQTNSLLRIAPARGVDSGDYRVRVIQGRAEAYSRTAALTVAGPPAILVDLTNVVALTGKPLLLAVDVDGTPPISFQWFKNNQPIDGAISSSFSVAESQMSDAGEYFVSIFTAGGNLTSVVSQVSVVIPPTINSISFQQTRREGEQLSLFVEATGSGTLSYQWYKDDAPINGATSSTYVVASARLEDSGNYKVEVRSEFAQTMSSPIPVSIQAPPSFVSVPGPQFLSVGQSVTLTPTVRGSSPLAFQWFKNGVALQGATANAFTILNAQLSHAGTYTLRVTNFLGSITSQGIVVQVGAPPSIVEHPASKEVQPGARVELSVVAQGATPLSYQWIKDGQAILNATSSNLVFESAKFEDTATYTVRVSNPGGSLTSNPANVVVVGAPEITVQPAPVTVAVGTPFTLSVQAQGTPPLRYEWRKDGSPIGGGTNASYSVASPQTSHSGNYQVIVRNGFGESSSASVAVSVLEKPSFTLTPARQMSAIAGSSISFLVQVNGSQPLSFQWYKDGTALPEARTHFFTINNVQTNDAGSYVVVVSNPVGTITNQASVVTVFVPARIVTPPTAQTVNLGAPASFQVEANGSATITYQWFKNGQALSGKTNASLTFPSTALEDEGSYSVRVANSAGNETSVAVPLTVIVPPVITAAPQGGTVLLGGQFTFRVEFSSKVPPSFQWFKNGAELPGETNESLVISSATVESAGNYHVRISNSAGSVTSGTAALEIAATVAVSMQKETGSVLLRATAVPGTRLEVQSNTELRTTGWTTVQVMTADAQGNAQLPQPISGSLRFYRLQVIQ